MTRRSWWNPSLVLVALVALAAIAMPARAAAQTASTSTTSVEAPPAPEIPDAPDDTIPPAPSTPPPMSLMDAVRTREGGLSLGTILEFVPGEHVVIRSYGGVERCFAWSDVAYAGPVTHELSVRLPKSTAFDGSPTRHRERRPPPARCVARSDAAPATDAEPPRHDAPTLARVELDGGDQGLTVHTPSDTENAWRRQRGPRRVPKRAPVCTTPCVAHLPPGRQTLAVSIGNRNPVRVRGDVEIRDGTRLLVSYESRRSRRVAGAITLALGLVLGAGLVTGVEIAGASCALPCNRTNAALLATGGALMGIGVGVGVPLVTRRDVARVTVVAGRVDASEAARSRRDTEGSGP